jgi:predicted RNase H-like HicB family nuclease/predicted RNA binding protein YcfA (HicA-like mRNA interferase family)
MPRKPRQLRAELRRAGFLVIRQEGSHETWEHPSHTDSWFTLAGSDGEDAKPYQERQVRDALESLRQRDTQGGAWLMNTCPRYSILIQWSAEDQAYLVMLPEWEGRYHNPVTHGDTYQQAVERAVEVLTMFVEIAAERGEALPAPHLYADADTAA